MKTRAGLALAAAGAAFADPLSLTRSGMDLQYDGIGGLSGGGATSRLLPDYPQKQRDEILDYLFLPNFGASLQILKVEIGGDSQSTDGTESSHMHSKDVVDYNTGYEWWLMREAKKRNPDIKLYGLPWAYPGWVGDDPVTGKSSGSPFTYPNQTAHYITEWLKGAKSYGLDIDFIGVWNERSSSADYVKSLKQTFASNGFTNTKIVAKDGGSDICTAMKADPEYAKNVDIIGLHYPSDYSNYDVCHSLKKPFWASEESSSMDDLNGAACWARVINSHYVLSGMTASIMWNLVGAYYHGTNWYASSMLTSVEPWSGHYDNLGPAWATAHVTQFTKIGWRYLKNGAGSGELPKGGFYTTIVDPNGDDFTLQVVKISSDHAACTRPHLPSFSVSDEEVTFKLADDMKAPAKLALWRSNFEQDPATLFEQQADIEVVNGTFTLKVVSGDFFTVSTVRTAKKGSHGTPPKSSPQLPLPHKENFEGVVESQEARYFTDQIGAFEVHNETGNPGNAVLRQMVPELPIGWSDHGSRGPMSLLGLREWRDLSVAVDAKVPVAAASGCVGTRSDQQWNNGVFLCVGTDGVWNLTNSGPPLAGKSYPTPVATGKAKTAPSVGKFFRLELSVINDTASGSVMGEKLFDGVKVRTLDTGFAVIGTNGWYHVEYDNFEMDALGSDWSPKPAPCGAAKVGSKVGVTACQANGVTSDDQIFELRANWQLRHGPSGLCAEASSTGEVSMQKCDGSKAGQQFRNDYTRIRNTVTGVSVDGKSLSGSTDGTVSSSAKGDWRSWSYFPNTKQLRNQYTAITKLGDPMCLSTCG